VEGNQKLKSSTPLFKWGKNVQSTIPCSDMKFKYVEESEMLNVDKNANRRKLDAKRKTARNLPSIPSKLCRKCSGWGRSGLREESLEDEVCSQCLGDGLKSGDSPYKDQLKDGPPFKLQVRPSRRKGMGTYAGQGIPDGVAVMGIEGLIMTENEAAKRDPEYKRKNLHYTVSVPGEWHGKGKRRRWVIDLTNMVIAHTMLNLFFTLRVRSLNHSDPHWVRRGAAG
jgi:hypothetical protein